MSITVKTQLSQLFNLGRFKIEDSFIKNLSNGSKTPAPEVLLENSQLGIYEPITGYLMNLKLAEH